MILEFEDEKGLLDVQTRALMQTCSQAAQRAEGVTLPLMTTKSARSTASSAARTPQRTCSPSRR